MDKKFSDKMKASAVKEEVFVSLTEAKTSNIRIYQNVINTAVTNAFTQNINEKGLKQHQNRNITYHNMKKKNW